MSGLETFLKQNKKKRSEEEVLYPASESFVDEEGKPMMWKIRPITSKKAEKIRSECNSIVGNKMVTDNPKWNRMLAAECTVFPNLNDAELQDSYGVLSAEELITELLDNDGEYQAYIRKITEVCGYAKPMKELVDDVKN